MLGHRAKTLLVAGCGSIAQMSMAADDTPIGRIWAPASGEQIPVSMTVTLVALLILFTAIGVWSAFSRVPFGILRKPRASNLFLGFRFQANGDAEQTGHLRSLDLRYATFIAPRFLTKGEHLMLRLSSLPGYPDYSTGSSEIPALVTDVQEVGGNPRSYLVRVKFESLSATQERPLTDYLAQILGPKTLPRT